MTSNSVKNIRRSLKGLWKNTQFFSVRGQDHGWVSVHHFNLVPAGLNIFLSLYLPCLQNYLIYKPDHTEFRRKFCPNPMMISHWTLVQVMAWCCQATSHHWSQCWPRFLAPQSVTKSQWVKLYVSVCRISRQYTSPASSDGLVLNIPWKPSFDSLLFTFVILVVLELFDKETLLEHPSDATERKTKIRALS